MVQLMPLHHKTPPSLASFKSRLALPFWCQITQVVLERDNLGNLGVVVVCGSICIYLLALIDCVCLQFFDSVIRKSIWCIKN